MAVSAMGAAAQNVQVHYDFGRNLSNDLKRTSESDGRAPITTTVEMFRGDTWGSAYFFIDMFDTIGTLVGVCTKADMLDSQGRIPRVKQAFMADAVATVAGACFGTSTTTTYVESAAGVAQGGRSGLTSFVVACCFFVALFFCPLFLAIPSAAMAPVLVIVGLFMLSPIRSIPLDDYAESIPAFICIIMMPLAYSISDGILLGMISYVAINVLCGNFKRLTPMMYVLAVLFMLKYIFF